MTDHKQSTINSYLQVKSWFRQVFVNAIEEHKQLDTKLHCILTELSHFKLRILMATKVLKAFIMT